MRQPKAFFDFTKMALTVNLSTVGGEMFIIKSDPFHEYFVRNKWFSLPPLNNVWSILYFLDFSTAITFYWKVIFLSLIIESGCVMVPLEKTTIRCFIVFVEIGITLLVLTRVIGNMTRIYKKTSKEKLNNTQLW